LPTCSDLEPEQVLASVRDQRILPAMHWRMNELWFLFPLPPAAPAPLCSERASHFSKLWTCASGAAANALPALNGIFPAKQSRINWLCVRSLGPGPDALFKESDSQALKLALDWALACVAAIMTAAVIRMADRRMFILPRVKANKRLDGYR
jgi:hypothetical protein